MRKFIADFRDYPARIECAGISYTRYYVLMPTYDEVALINRYRLDNADFEDTLNTLILAIFEKSYKDFRLYCGCLFFDKEKDMNFLFNHGDNHLKKAISRLVEMNHSRDFSDFGKCLLKSYYFKNLSFLMDKVKGT